MKYIIFGQESICAIRKATRVRDRSRIAVTMCPSKTIGLSDNGTLKTMPNLKLASETDRVFTV